MPTRKTYKTKQRECVLDCIRRQAGAYITIQQLSDELERRGEKVGLTTIYRTLDRLEQDKAIAKVSIDGVGAACYRYLPQEDDVFFCLKCESCGRVINIDCAELSHLYHHLSRAHNIRINPGKTMFYGTCETCIAKGRTEDAGAKEGLV
ncbi:MAG TPA: transcriptional repressor [Firmicutes bacterium]|nr:transcriptional repressor [Bacillota bacterium]